MLKQEDNFCPAPWTSLYHMVNKNSPCHTNRSFNVETPMQYFSSDRLKQIKEDFHNNVFTESCAMCKAREDHGLKSTRKEIIRIFNAHTSHDKLSVQAAPLKRIELRLSNLCNYKCRMCEPYSSSELALEMITHSKFNFPDNAAGEHVLKTSEEQIDELKKLSHTIEVLCLTGGEPFLIKQYYDFLDYLIENDLSKNIIVELYTNCSVYNEKMIEKLLKFKAVRLVVSIDGVGKTAEYIRHGTKWETVKQNIFAFAQLPFYLHFNTAISPYTLFDVYRLSEFLVELYERNKNIKTKCYSVITPIELHYNNMSVEHRKIAIDQIDKACEILVQDNFKIFVKELQDLKNILITNDPIDPNRFIEFTQRLDSIRNENFEEVFGFSLTSV